MTAARLSPAANLLRNSRLFAIPAAVSLPAVEPSSEPISYSDSATTPYPTRAALETPLTSLNQGDWGLKRPLPIKTTTKSSTPLVRFQRGIDTPEHVVDFESAADHVLTLRKYQELNLRVVLPAPRDRKSTLNPQRTSAFDPEVDHTTDQPPPVLNGNASTSWLDESVSERAKKMPQHLKDALEKIIKERADATNPGVEVLPTQAQPSTSAAPQSMQTARRWRYSGPYLAGLNGLEFDGFLKGITREKKAAFRELVKSHLAEQRAQDQRLKALEEGQADAAPEPPSEITDQDVTAHLRYLRSEPGKFGPLIAEFFDLADGPKPSSDTTDPWSYGRDTVSADLYKESGPPRTHPSAGLAYIKTEVFASNDAVTGPRGTRAPVAARLLRSIQSTHNKHIPFVGVAGFVVPQPTNPGISEQNWKWAPVKDGPKLVVTPTAANISQAGKVEIQTRMQPDWVVEDDVPVNVADRRNPKNTSAPMRTLSSQLPTLTSFGRKELPVRRPRPAPEPSQNIDEEIGLLLRANSKYKPNKLT
ncbi:uncharacterized protein A1O5_10043 [Cladophialophora psammophila CBS 110553]|uniref:Uncharacterized protein n=1 Tax=Cladophialophora psammophila CBS 110553 TaxID=1182543 RepID=W9WG20_9EURO|nr:uncharacterized protein A1O5_10043 [Cladophialophora psammophila CBS 110553]EXJ66848.1 hypothetical protein A1O5_10043 [Cladophialophora psammophila CBS 110553]